MQRLYFALDLDDDPAAIAAYENWHRPDRIWPEIVSQLRASGVHELEVFRCGNRLVMVKQVPDELADQDPASHEDKRTEEWEQLMWQFQRPLPCREARSEMGADGTALFPATDPRRGRVVRSRHLRATLISTVALIFVGAITPARSATPAYVPAATNLAARKWYANARFGMFIHWGVYSVPARGEWVMEHEHIPVSSYEKFAPQFDPTRFDPRAIVALAKLAGMKYITITSQAS